MCIRLCVYKRIWEEFCDSKPLIEHHQYQFRKLDFDATFQCLRIPLDAPRTSYHPCCLSNVKQGWHDTRGAFAWESECSPSLASYSLYSMVYAFIYMHARTHNKYEEGFVSLYHFLSFFIKQGWNDAHCER